MPYLIDGHNLIGKIPGLQLADLDDEKELIELLQSFCQRSGKDVHVYFDGAPSGQARARVHGRVTAHYVRIGTAADIAIGKHLKRLGSEAANWTVVSSDREVQNMARRARAHLFSSEEFMPALFGDEDDRPGLDAAPKISDEELDDWLSLFGGE